MLLEKTKGLTTYDKWERVAKHIPEVQEYGKSFMGKTGVEFGLSV